MTIDGAGNTLSSARELNITPTKQTFTDWVGSSDLEDIYRLNITSSSSFNLSLDGLSADADVQLIWDSNSNLVIDSSEIIASSTAGSTTAESISRSLDIGTYYIRVYPYGSANTNYNLSVSATVNDFAGNTLNNARQITLNSTSSTYGDWVGSTDTDDLYRFNLSANSSVNLALNGLTENADVQLLNSSGNAIASSTNGGVAAEAISRSLDAGTYYIRVYPYSSAGTNYNLNVSATINDFAGNTLNSARQITLNSTGNTYSDWVGSTDTDDLYRFNLSANSSFNLALNNLVADADVHLIRDTNSNGVVDSGEVIASSTAGSTNAESISRSLDAGTYYIRVYLHNGANTNYNLSVSATINDFAGNTLNSARQLTLNSTNTTYSDWVGSTDTDDLYRFNLSANSSFNLAMNGVIENADVQLIRDANSNGVIDSGEVIASSTAGGVAAEAINRSLDAGTYYIRVYPFGGANTNYNLNVSATINDFAGNTLTNARQITLNSTTSTYSDWVGNTDTDDIYRFNLSANSSFNLALNNLVADADVHLIRDTNSNGVVDSGEVIASSTAGSTNAESISRSLDAGTYYIRVYPHNGANTNYNLSVSATINDFAGNTFNSARQLTLNSTNTTYSDWVGSTDTDDLYRFNLSANSSFNLAMSGVIENADVQLIRDANSNLVIDSGEVIASSAAGGVAAEAINRSLDAGTYYIRVYPFGGANTNYNLNVSATINDFAGNTLTNARQITLNSTTSTYSDWVGNTDTDDLYRFNLSANSSFNLALNNLVADADVHLIRDANSNGVTGSGEVIASSTAGSTNAESISRTLDAGTYYIRVYPHNGANTNYNLSVSATPNDYAGNTLNNARQITLNSTTSNERDWVSSADTNDYYRFNLDATRNINLTLDGLSGNADVQLLDSSGNAIALSTSGGTAAESISRILSAGTYYVRVYPGESGASTFYNLSIESRTVPIGSNNLNLEWIRQLGTAGDDSSYSVAADNAGNVYITGYTDGSLGGTNAVGVDAWLAKYSSSGALLWTRQLGTSGDDRSYSVAADSAGNVYITGDSNGSLGATNAGNQDTWLAKYDTLGNRLWTRQLGSSGDDSSYGVAVDNVGNVYITGFTDGSLGGTNVGDDTYDAWVAKYDSLGNRLWTKQLGTEGDDRSYSVAVDSTGNVYITGFTEGNLGQTNAGNIDAWLAKYDTLGNRLWTKQLGSSGDDSSYGVAVDNAGNVYITGDTNGALAGTNAGEDTADAWVAKYDSLGNRLWTKQLGTESDDFSYSVATDNTGNVYITGDTVGTLAGTSAGSVDAWVAKYDSSGNQLLIRQLGTSSKDSSIGVAVDGIGNVYLTGDTDGTLNGTSAGSVDAWIVKYR